MLWWKAFHVVSVISWMAGQLYLYRLFVYHAMETENVVRERFQLMETRLLRAIATPAAIASLVSGLAMLYLQPDLLKQPWMHVKLTMVLGMFAMHGLAAKYRKQLAKEPTKTPHQTFRFLNEVPTILMIVIVIMVIVQPWAK
jgi:putative membrane protein